jgi:hypothetical protein
MDIYPDGPGFIHSSPYLAGIVAAATTGTIGIGTIEGVAIASV